MTVMPITQAPVDAAAPGTAGTPGPAGDFLAAILQALAPGADTTPDGATAAAVPETPDADPAALGLVVPPGLAAQLVPPAVVADDVAPGHADVAPEAAETPTSTTGDIRMSGGAAATTAPTAPQPPAPPTPAAGPGAATTDRGTDASPAGGGGAVGPDQADQAYPDPGTVAAATTRRTADADRSETAAPATTQPAPTVSAASPSPTATSTAPASTTAPQHVTRQVFPEVTRLVSRGDGTHRITLDLNPESLGEVRVVMTVRDGAVHVRFAAGHEAGRALLEGSAELNRLLGAAGASETRIVVRELSAASLPTAGSADGTAADNASAGRDPGLGAGGHRPHDEHAGTRADTPATDGTHDSTTAGASPPRSIQPVTRTRTAGVDVTM